MNTNHPQTPDPALQQPVSPCALPIWRVGKWQWDFTRPLIMGILNLSPESFSDGREVLSGRVDRAVARGVELIGQGADILDIGGASSHPQAPAVDPLEEFRRVEPVIRELAALGLVPLSIDTTRPLVAKGALEAGAVVLNDVSGLADVSLGNMAADHDAVLVIAHNGWWMEKTEIPENRPNQGILERVRGHLAGRVRLAESLGVKKMILDPGYGFGKSLEENMILLRELAHLTQPPGRENGKDEAEEYRLGLARWPVMVGVSRKGSLGVLTGEQNPQNRLGASLAASLYAALNGAHILRVHDVREMRQALTVWQAIQNGGPV